MDSYNIGTVWQYREVGGGMWGYAHGDTSKGRERKREKERKRKKDGDRFILKLYRHLYGH